MITESENSFILSQISMGSKSAKMAFGSLEFRNGATNQISQNKFGERQWWAHDFSEFGWVRL